MSIFKTSGVSTYDNSTSYPFWSLPSVDIFSQNVELSRIGVITYQPTNGESTEIQRLQRNDFYNIEKSKLTKSTEKFPTYLLENSRIFINPKTIDNTSGSINIDFIRTPLSPIWGFTVGNLGQYIYDFTDFNDNVFPNTGSRDFELDSNEQTNIIIRILKYSGVVINDPAIVQAATQEVAKKEINEKS